MDISDLDMVSSRGLKEMEQNGNLLKSAVEAMESPVVKATRAMECNSSVQRMIADVERQQRMIRSIEGPQAELRAGGIFDEVSKWQGEFEKIRQLMADYSGRFVLPDTDQIAKLAQESRLSGVAQLVKQLSEPSFEIQRAMEAMRMPWLDAQRALDSVSGFSELQSIGHALNRIPAFDDQFSIALRESLGDWRDLISWPEKISTDLVARSEFYGDLGFDPDLTDFPAPAFQESVDAAGLRRDPPPLIALYDSPISRPETDEESLARTKMAFEWLLGLETNLRQYIDHQMTQAFGSDWPKHRLPPRLYEKWMEKKENAESAGRREWPLIAYADFTDYAQVICKRDNWREVFSGSFDRPESVRESFQRLHMIRIDTMHARPIGQDDELLLYVEVKRLIQVVVALPD